MNEIDNYRVPDKAPERPDERPTLNVKRGVSDLALDAGLPANIDAEKTILGAVLLDNAAYKEASERIDAEDFSLDSHRRIFLRMSELMDGQHSVDIVTLANELSMHREISAIGGVAYLASLTEGLPRRPVIGEYLKIVKDKSLLRRLMSICSTTIARAADQNDSAVNLIDNMKVVIAEVESQVTWRDPDSVLVSAIDFCLSKPPAVEWLIDGVIQRNGNGLIVADGKTGKSLLAIHMAIFLATGTDWLGLRVPRRVPVALISREDDPGETARRVGSFVSGCGLLLNNRDDLDGWFWLNTRAQTPTFTLENKRELNEIIAALKRRKVEFAIFDVFRSIWTGDENDNMEVSRVLEALRMVQREVGCAVCLLHHLNKSDGTNIFSKIRGGSAIRGWQEWGFGVTIVNQEANEDEWVRCIRFETKAARAHRKMFYKIAGPAEAMHIELCDAPETPRITRRRSATSIISGGREKAYKDND